MWAAVSWSLLTDNIGRGRLEGLAAVPSTGPGLFWLTPDATLAGGQYPGHALSLPGCCRLRGAPGISGVLRDRDPGLFSRHRIILWDFPLMIWRPSNQLEDDFYRRSFDRRTRWTHRTSFTNHTRSKLRLCGYFYYTLSQDGQATSQMMIPGCYYTTITWIKLFGWLSLRGERELIRMRRTRATSTSDGR